MSQMELVDLDSLVSSTHPHRRFHAFLSDATAALADVRRLKGTEGYGVERLFRCRLVQFMEDLSDRELALVSIIVLICEMCGSISNALIRRLY